MTNRRYDLAMVFTGHLVDLPGRPTPRFPPAMEPAAARAITTAVERVRTQAAGSVLAVSSGGRGGDLMFQEACRLHGLETHLVLPFAPEDFIATSVAGVPGSTWTDRFWAAWNAAGKDGRVVLPGRASDDAFARCNDAMIEMARARARTTALIAFWNGQGGDGPGGTADLVARVRAAGGMTVVVDAAQLLREHSHR